MSDAVDRVQKLADALELHRLAVRARLRELESQRDAVGALDRGDLSAAAAHLAAASAYGTAARLGGQ